MRILVTGSKGQLGSDLLDVLPPPCTARGLDLPELDITDARSVRDAVETFRPDVVVNCAAYTRVDAAETDPHAAWAVNEEGPRNLAQAAAGCGARLLHVSTDYVFDGVRPRPGVYTERDRPTPASVYGASKLGGEEAVRDALPEHAILRTAWLYGAQGQNFLKTILRLALEDPSRPLRVVDDQYGSPTWSGRLARQIVALLDTGRGLYHASAEGSCSWYELAGTFLEALEVAHALEPCTTGEYPTAARRPTNSVLENERLKEEGRNVMLPWQDDVRAFASRYRDGLLREARGESR